MTKIYSKQEILNLCETNERLKNLALTLFAEIAELVSGVTREQLNISYISVVYTKVEEFEYRIITEMIKGSSK